MVANVTGLSVGDFVHTLGDAHIYKNHFDQAKLQLSRSMKNLPYLKFNKNLIVLMILSMRILKF